jgi:Ring finger domain
MLPAPAVRASVHLARQRLLYESVRADALWPAHTRSRHLCQPVHTRAQVIDATAVQANLAAWGSGASAIYQLFFSFEYAILACTAFSAAVKYGFALVDTALEHRWPQKGLYTLYLELFMDVVHFLLYTAFFGSVVHATRQVPFHLIFDVFSAYRSLFKRATNYLRYRAVMSKIHSLAPATADDVARVGGTCIICRDDMAETSGLRKLACDHVFHLPCLQSWLERQQTCPICRTAIFGAPRTAPRRGQPPQQQAQQPPPQQQQRREERQGAGGRVLGQLPNGSGAAGRDRHGGGAHAEAQARLDVLEQHL